MDVSITEINKAYYEQPNIAIETRHMLTTNNRTTKYQEKRHMLATTYLTTTKYSVGSKVCLEGVIRLLDQLKT